MKRLSPPLKAGYPGVPWRQIAGFRDVLIHNDMGVDVPAVRNVIVRDLPGLKRAVKAMRAGVK